MTTSDEYEFVRLGEGRLNLRTVARDTYQEVVLQHARDGWRLAQIFAPDLNFGAAKYDELVFERERRSGCPRGGGPSGWRRSTSPWEDRVKGGPRPGGPRPRRGRGGR